MTSLADRSPVGAVDMPQEHDPETRRRAALAVCRHCPEGAAELLAMLGLDKEMK